MSCAAGIFSVVFVGGQIALLFYVRQIACNLRLGQAPYRRCVAGIICAVFACVGKDAHMFIDKVSLIPFLSRILDVAATRHKAIASNMANIATPGYRHLTVSFGEHFKRALHRTGSQSGTHASHIALGEGQEAGRVAKIVSSNRPVAPEGINNVDINEEMASLAKNQLYYQFAAGLIAKQFRALKGSITGRMG